MEFKLKFCLQAGDSTREKVAIFSASRKLGYEFICNKTCPPNHIPIGDVPFCETVLPVQNKTIDFYPEFLKEYRHREIGFSTFGGVEGGNHDSPIKRKKFFLKKAQEWKSDFQSRIVEWDEKIPYDFYYYSEVVEFVQEWRYYVAGGVLITTGWYAGIDEDEPAPELNIEWPQDFNAATDFGRLKDGRIAIVESHAPFACGWYGNDHRDYANWQYEAWINYIKSLENKL